VALVMVWSAQAVVAAGVVVADPVEAEEAEAVGATVFDLAVAVALA
jgi:hypothetical protein